MRQSESSRSIEATRASRPGRTSCCIAVSKSVLPTRIEPPKTRAAAITTGQRERPDQRERRQRAERPDREGHGHRMARPDPVRDEAADHAAERGRADDQAPGRRAAEAIDGDERADHDVQPDAEVADGVAEEAGGEPAVAAHLAASPRARSRQKRCAAGFAYGATRIAATKSTLKRKLPASIANTQPAPATATIAPASAGPKTFVALRESEISAFACCSRPALTVCGIERLRGRVEEARGRSRDALRAPRAARRAPSRRRGAPPSWPACRAGRGRRRSSPCAAAAGPPRRRRRA